MGFCEDLRPPCVKSAKNPEFDTYFAGFVSIFKNLSWLTQLFWWICVRSSIHSIIDTTFVSIWPSQSLLTQLSSKNLCQSILIIKIWHRQRIFCVNSCKKMQSDTICFPGFTVVLRNGEMTTKTNPSIAMAEGFWLGSIIRNDWKWTSIGRKRGRFCRFLGSSILDTLALQ